MNSLRLEVYPCIDQYEGENYCKTREYIDEYLNNLLFMIYLEDINLTPLNYVNPVKKKINSLIEQKKNVYGECDIMYSYESEGEVHEKDSYSG